MARYDMVQRYGMRQSYYSTLRTARHLLWRRTLLWCPANYLLRGHKRRAEKHPASGKPVTRKILQYVQRDPYNTIVLALLTIIHFRQRVADGAVTSTVGSRAVVGGVAAELLVIGFGNCHNSPEKGRGDQDDDKHVALELEHDDARYLRALLLSYRLLSRSHLLHFSSWLLFSYLIYIVQHKGVGVVQAGGGVGGVGGSGGDGVSCCGGCGCALFVLVHRSMVQI